MNTNTFVKWARSLEFQFTRFHISSINNLYIEAPAVSLSAAPTKIMNIPSKILALAAAAFLAGNANAETIYGVTVFRDLITFDNAAPSDILSTTPITGLTGQDQFESVRHIDFRPATGQLYAVGNAPGGIFRLYTINLSSGVASRVGGNLNSIGGSFGFNFDPTADLIRVVTDDGKNLRYSPVDGSLVPTAGSALAYASGDPNFGATPNIVTASHTNSVANATTTALYDIDAAKGTLVRQNPPNNGTLNTNGNLGIALPNYIDGVNLDIAPDSGVAYLAISDPDPSVGKTQLYRVNLSSGAATDFGEIGSGLILNGISVPLPPPPSLPHIASISKTGPSLPGGNIRFTAGTKTGLKVRMQATTDDPLKEGSWTDLPGGQMTENHPTNPGAGNYTLVSNTYPQSNGVSFRAISSKQDFVDGKSDVLGPYDLRVPQPPSNGGLSKTVFTVNESSLPSADVTDKVLRFAAVQTGRPGGLRVRVQATTTPGNSNSWTDLPNGNGGRMILDEATNQFVLNTTDYPLQNGVYFRAISYAGPYPDSISNEVGKPNGFNLATNKPHLSPTGLLTLGQGTIDDFYFLAGADIVPNGVSMRIQSSTTPAEETSWTTVANGQMQRSANPDYPRHFILLGNNYPAAKNLYFRAIASLAGSVDSISNLSGPFELKRVTPPAVTMQKPKGVGGSGNGNDPQHPIILPVGSVSFGATAQGSRPISKLELQIDGATVAEFGPGESGGAVKYPIGLGDHVLEAVATDDLGARARGGTAPVHIRVVPAGRALQARAEAPNAPAAQAVGKTFVVAKNNGFWNNETTWRDQQGNTGIPGQDDSVIIGGSTVRFQTGAGAARAKALSIDGGRLDGNTVVQIYGQMTVFAATFEGAVVLEIQPGAVCELLNASNVQFNANAFGGGAIRNYGTVNVHGGGGVVGAERIANFGTVNWQLPISSPPNAATDPSAAIRAMGAGRVEQAGRITGTLTSTPLAGGALLEANNAKLVRPQGGNIISRDSAGVVSNDGAGIVAGGGGNLIGQDGAALIGNDGAGLIGSDGAGFTPRHVLHAQGDGATMPAERSAGSTSTEDDGTALGFVQTAGETDLSKNLLYGPVTIDGGTLTGSGIIRGSLTNNSYLLPGNSAGIISILGDYTQGANGTLVIENGGPVSGQYDQLQVSGVAKLGGKLQVRTINGYTPDAADTFNPLGYQSVSGAFASVSGNTQLSLKAGGALARIDPKVANPPSPKALNISTRMRVETGDNALIAGFIVTGSQPKKVIIRGLGPSLPVPGAVADTTLNLDAGAIVNDDWRSTQQQAIKATGIPPSSNLESAIVATLAPGGHTAILRGKDNTTGVGLVEVYDLEAEAPAQLANISTRGLVQTGDNVMIGGFIIGGNAPAKVLLRAIGPSLPVAGALQDPVLDLVDKNGNTISNDNWRSTQEAEIIGTTVPPTNEKEAAILANLAPGDYTAIVRGKDGTIGVALVECYNIQ